MSDIKIGNVYETNNSGSFIVEHYINSQNIHIRFLATGYKNIVGGYQIRSGQITDRLLPNVYSIGIIGDCVSKVNGKHTKQYAVWREMLKRCYDQNYQSKFPTYLDCHVEEFFHYLPNFSRWVCEQKGFSEANWDFDKDILGNGKFYSRDFCVFVPKEVNYAFLRWEKRDNSVIPVGVRQRGNSYESRTRDFEGKIITKFSKDIDEIGLWFKHNKRAYLQFLGEKWKDKLDNRVYQKLISYNFEDYDEKTITD